VDLSKQGVYKAFSNWLAILLDTHNDEREIDRSIETYR
jgi:hypothetical protein